MSGKWSIKPRPLSPPSVRPQAHRCPLGGAKCNSIPCEPGQPEKVDSVYVRNGVADVFIISEPLAGRRETVVTQTRTALDFANILQYTADTLYPCTEKIVLVTDNLNTHSPASLYKEFQPEEARRLAERFEWHYTPKHGSWLDMAEIEIAILSR